MKKLFTISLMLAAGSAWSLDNTINNDFWDTTAYVNPTTSSAASTVGTKAASGSENKSFFSGIVRFFSTFKAGFGIIFK